MFAAALLWAGGLFLVASVIVVVLEVIYRYLLRKPFTSSGDILTFAFTWLIFLGIPRAVWRNKAVKLG